MQTTYLLQYSRISFTWLHSFSIYANTGRRSVMNLNDIVASKIFCLPVPWQLGNNTGHMMPGLLTSAITLIFRATVFSLGMTIFFWRFFGCKRFNPRVIGFERVEKGYTVPFRIIAVFFILFFCVLMLKAQEKNITRHVYKKRHTTSPIHLTHSVPSVHVCTV